MKKRGQFTILVVFALLAIMVVGLVLFVRSSIMEQTSEQAAEEALSNYLESNQVNAYVESCVQSVAEQALLLSAYQGGYIWEHQNGSGELGEQGIDNLQIPENGEQYNVSYVIKSNNHAPCRAIRENASSATDHPLPKKKISEMDQNTISQHCPADTRSGFYGVIDMPVLCTFKGSNWEGNPDRPTTYRTCRDYAYKSQNPIQYQLRNYTERQLMKCTDFEQFESKYGYNVEILNQPNVTYTFGKDQVIVKAGYPVKVSRGDTPPVEVTTTFEKKVNARFKKLYETYQDYIRREVRSLNQPLEVSNGFEVEYVEDPCHDPEICPPPYNYSDMIVIKDTKQLVGNRQLVWRGIVMNRRPVIDYIGETRIEKESPPMKALIIITAKSLPSYSRNEIVQDLFGVSLSDIPRPDIVIKEISIVDPDDKDNEKLKIETDGSFYNIQGRDAQIPLKKFIFDDVPDGGQNSDSISVTVFDPLWQDLPIETSNNEVVNEGDVRSGEWIEGFDQQTFEVIAINQQVCDDGEQDVCQPGGDDRDSCDDHFDDDEDYGGQTVPCRSDCTGYRWDLCEEEDDESQDG